MTKIINIFLSVVFLLATTTVFANTVCKYYPGIVTCGKGTIADVNGLGLVSLDGTTVTNSLNVTGAINAANSDLNRILSLGNISIRDSIIHGPFDITGAATITNCQIQNKLKIVGMLSATASSFFSTLEITSLETTLQQATTKSILVHRDSHPNEKNLFA